jgi:hypothetical protein
MTTDVLDSARAVTFALSEAITESERDPFVLTYAESIHRLHAAFFRQAALPADDRPLADAFVAWVEAGADALAHERTGGGEAPDLANRVLETAATYESLLLAQTGAHDG